MKIQLDYDTKTITIECEDETETEICEFFDKIEDIATSIMAAKNKCYCPMLTPKTNYIT